MVSAGDEVLRDVIRGMDVKIHAYIKLSETPKLYGSLRRAGLSRESIQGEPARFKTLKDFREPERVLRRAVKKYEEELQSKIEGVMTKAYGDVSETVEKWGGPLKGWRKIKRRLRDKVEFEGIDDYYEAVEAVEKLPSRVEEIMKMDTSGRFSLVAVRTALSLEKEAGMRAEDLLRQADIIRVFAGRKTIRGEDVKAVVELLK